MKEAYLYQKLENDNVRCNLCAHRCVIHRGKAGICHVRKNIDGVLYTLAYGRTIAQHVDSIEKKPLYHFSPGSKAFSVATAGCNFHCRFCQNHSIAQPGKRELFDAGEEASPGRSYRAWKKQGVKALLIPIPNPRYFMNTPAILPG